MIQPTDYIKVIDGKVKMPVYAFADFVNEFVDKNGMIDIEITIKELHKAKLGIRREQRE